MAFNKVILVGNIAQDLELKQTTTGIPVVRFSLAVNRRFIKAGEQTQTDFFDIVCWRGTAEFVCKYFSKGKGILICGSLQTRQWEDKQGQKRISFEIIADEATFVEKKSSGDSQFSDPNPNNRSVTDRTTPYSTTAPYNPSVKEIAFDEISSDDELPF